MRPLPVTGFCARRVGFYELRDGLLDVFALHRNDSAHKAFDRLAKCVPVQSGGCLNIFRHGTQEGHTPPGGLVEALQALDGCKGIAGLRGGERGGLGAVRHFAHSALCGFAGIGVVGEGLHSPFARHGVGKAVIREFSSGSVNFCFAAAVPDCDGEFHAAVGSGVFLCKLCANFLRIACFLNEKWCA